MLVRDVPKRKFLPTLERAEPIVYDHTAIKTFMKCPREYFYRIVCGRKQKKQELEVIYGWGNAIHKFAECHGKGMTLEKCREEAFMLYKIPPPGSKWDHLDMKRFADTMKMLGTFLDNERAERVVTCENIEQPFNMDMPDGEQIGGRWDATIKFAGQSWVRDWKTTTKRNDWFADTLNPNDQATRYVYAYSRAMGWTTENRDRTRRCQGIEFVIIENQKPSKKSRENPGSDASPPKLVKHPISKSDDELITFEQEQLHYHKLIDTCRTQDVWPMSPTNCSWCDYKSVCRKATDSSREYALRTEFVHSVWDHTKVGQTTTEEG